MQNAVWQLKEEMPQNFIKKFPHYPAVFSRVLWSRDLRSKEDIEKFLQPSFPQDLRAARGLKGMMELLGRIKKAIKKNERILIFGDGDCDGICGTIILKSLLERIGCRSVEIYLPNWEKEGHGLNEWAVKSFVLKNIKLIVTIDCGISNKSEIALAKKLGMAVIVIDHHQVPLRPPQAAVILDPYQKGEKYPFRGFAGTGLVFKVVQAAIEDKGLKHLRNLSWDWAKQFLDLVVLATIGDMMPLRDENRTLVSCGLPFLKQTKRVGLKSLIAKTHAFDKDRPRFNGDTTEFDDVGRILVPPINAAGRMAHSSASFDLLTTASQKEGERLADFALLQNKKKQKELQRMIRRAESNIRKEDMGRNFFIFEGAPGWSITLVGIVAGRLAEKYWRPACVFRKDKKESIASCRAIPGYNLVEAFRGCSRFLAKYGGHKAAAGFTVVNKHLRSLIKSLNSHTKKMFSGGLPARPLHIDSKLMGSEVNVEFLKHLAVLEPFGMANPKPKFLMEKLEVLDFEIVGNHGRHLKVHLLSEDEKHLKGIWFFNGNKVHRLTKGSIIDIVCELEKDEWQGRKNVLLKIIDLKTQAR